MLQEFSFTISTIS